MRTYTIVFHPLERDIDKGSFKWRQNKTSYKNKQDSNDKIKEKQFPVSHFTSRLWAWFLDLENDMKGHFRQFITRTKLFQREGSDKKKKIHFKNIVSIIYFLALSLIPWWELEGLDWAEVELGYGKGDITHTKVITIVKEGKFPRLISFGCSNN